MKNGLLDVIGDERTDTISRPELDVSTLAALPASRGELEPAAMRSVENGGGAGREAEPPSATP